MSKIEEGQNILRAFGLPPAQQNQAAACTLLALAGVTEQQAWSAAGRRLLRVHGIIQFINANYDRDYKENTRESIRKFVLHQFEQAGIVERNPDEPARSTNSGKNCYAMSPQAQAVIVLYDDSRQFLTAITEFQKNHPALLEIYRAARTQHVVAIELPAGLKAFLSPGKHNKLQKAIIDEFWPRFIPNAKLLYLGDTAKKDYYVERDSLDRVGLPWSIHDKFPDLVFWLEEQNWLILVEAVTTHGPFSPKRRAELESLLNSSPCHRVFVTCFPTWKEFKQWMDQLAWETEIWLAEVPDHMIHYNGPKFLAPLPKAER